jgi:hypothetical protein
MIFDTSRKAEATQTLEWVRSRLQVYASLGVIFSQEMLVEMERRLDLVARLDAGN